MSESGLAQGRLGAWGIVFFVVSAAAPLTVIATTPFSVRVGGIGAPGAYLAAGVVLTLFAIGFTAMTRYVRNAGAFYAYASRGLGRDAGNGVAVMTACCYGVMVTGFYGFIGFYAQLEVQRLLGFDLPWWVAGLGCAVLVGVLGYRQVDVGAKVLAVLLTAEVVVLVIFAVAVLVQQRPEPLTAAPLAPSHVFASGAGALFVIGFGSYIGFEGTAIYVEEAKRPERTIPRATYAAIAFLSVFYAFCAWVLVQAWGVTGMLEGAHREGEFYGEMLFVAAEDYAGRGLASSMSLLVVTSFLAAAVAFHNACARYLFAMGRTGLLPARFARTHPRMRSPYVASVTITVVVLAGIVVGVLAGADPLQFAFWTYAPGRLRRRGRPGRRCAVRAGLLHPRPARAQPVAGPGGARARRARARRRALPDRHELRPDQRPHGLGELADAALHPGDLRARRGARAARRGGGRTRSEVEAGRLVAEAVGGDRVDVALAHHDVDLAGDLDLRLVVGVVEHLVAGHHGSAVRADGDDARPGQAAGAHRCGRGDDDATGGAALAGLGVGLAQDAVVQHLDGGLVGHGCRGS
ncbi:amino acid permease-associated region [Pimelobacter simplex]|uniref:Amino acid permease-associated region n=1 Tax=Nocardioides simplex TaxID=2045 RepID=A0A0C5XL84_NOCSI|nr:amino acid permease-associated region [Pimelobacter simplex]GEB15640.1 hypothetical protein NSI01_39550 [Pimelobacter simplex]SFM57244.1 Amino acid transporter [Pimelobacter simplex]